MYTIWIQCGYGQITICILYGRILYPLSIQNGYRLDTKCIHQNIRKILLKPIYKRIVSILKNVKNGYFEFVI